MKTLSQEQVEQFQRDGYILLSGMLGEDQVERLAAAAEALVQQRPPSGYATFTLVEKGCIFDPAGEFRDVAIRSKLGAVSAELMQLDPDTQNCRVLRDVFLAKPVNASTVCDYHVDDQLFWPSRYKSEASLASGKDQNGINVWLALDDMPADCAGSMAVAPGSHRAEWRARAYDALGQNRDVDVDYTMDDLVRFFADPQKRGTCTIGNVDAELRDMIDAQSKVFGFKRGDCLFCTRLLFHRTLDVTPKGKSFYGKPTLNRYSIRYVPGSARLPGVYNSLDWALLADESNAGQTLDDVVRRGHCWYPQVWPAVEPDVDQKLDDVARAALCGAKAKVAATTKQMFAAAEALKARDVQEVEPQEDETN